MLSRTMRYLNNRSFQTSARLLTAWSPQPAPPRLPKEEQDIFDQLQKQSTGAFSTPRQPPKINQSPNSSPSSPNPDGHATSLHTQRATDEDEAVRADVKKGDELHPNVRRGSPPEFEGDTDPRTGEVGGPKNNPIRWQQMQGDWSYNGRVSDF